MQTIEITSATGTGPYDIYLCDITLTYCYLISGSTNIPPNYTFTIPYNVINYFPPPANLIFEGSQQLIIKLVDSVGCEFFQVYTCFTPTPTPTPTLTPSPTPTSTCRCITFENYTGFTCNFSYVDCNSNNVYSTINSGTTLYYCGSLPTADYGVSITLGDVCVDNTCPSTYCEPFDFCFELFDGSENLLLQIHFVEDVIINGRKSWVSDYPSLGISINWDNVINQWIIPTFYPFIINTDPSSPPINGWVYVLSDFEIICTPGQCPPLPTPTPSPTSTPTPSPSSP